MNAKLPEAPVLMLVTDRRRAGASLLTTIDRAVDAGVDVVQIREKDLNQDELFLLAREILSVVAGRARLVVNTDAVVARALGIGLHLPEALPRMPDGPDTLVGEGVLVGRSIHAAGATEEKRVDYLLFGHVFASGSKPGVQPRGLDALADAVGRCTKPVWAIGGITVANASEVIERGAKGVAVIGAIFDAPDPWGTTRELRSVIDRAAATHSTRT